MIVLATIVNKLDIFHEIVQQEAPGHNKGFYTQKSSH